MDRDEYSRLDRGSLEAEPGFKIFVFHGAIEELKPPALEQMGAMPASDLPAGFDYYAGGHVHGRLLRSLPGRQNVAFPGPLFATDYSELLQLAKGEKRGFYIVDYEERVSRAEFVPVSVCEVVEVYYSAHGKSSSQAAKELIGLASETNVGGKVALLTVEGELSEGKTSDIDFAAVRRRLSASAPLIVLANYSRLTSKEQVRQEGPPKPVHVTERELFEREMSGAKSEEANLRGEKGVSLAVDLLRTLKEGKKENEAKGAFEERTYRAGFAVLGLEADG